MAARSWKFWPKRLRTYVTAHGKITDSKIASKENIPTQLCVSPVRMSFKTLKPFDTYHEPKEKIQTTLEDTYGVRNFTVFCFCTKRVENAFR